jgi:hypothetical protein
MGLSDVRSMGSSVTARINLAGYQPDFLRQPHAGRLGSHAITPRMHLLQAFTYRVTHDGTVAAVKPQPDRLQHHSLTLHIGTSHEHATRPSLPPLKALLQQLEERQLPAADCRSCKHTCCPQMAGAGSQHCRPNPAQPATVWLPMTVITSAIIWQESCLLAKVHSWPAQLRLSQPGCRRLVQTAPRKQTGLARQALSCPTAAAAAALTSPAPANWEARLPSMGCPSSRKASVSGAFETHMDERGSCHCGIDDLEDAARDVRLDNRSLQFGTSKSCRAQGCDVRSNMRLADAGPRPEQNVRQRVAGVHSDQSTDLQGIGEDGGRKQEAATKRLHLCHCLLWACIGNSHINRVQSTCTSVHSCRWMVAYRVCQRRRLGSVRVRPGTPPPTWPARPPLQSRWRPSPSCSGHSACS